MPTGDTKAATEVVGEAGTVVAETAPKVASKAGAEVTEGTEAVLPKAGTSVAGEAGNIAKETTKSGVSKVWNYSQQFESELENFNPGYKIKTSVDRDLYLVQYHSNGEVGTQRSLKYWTTTNEANDISTIKEYMDRMALLKEWGARDHVTVAKIPAGSRVKYAIGTAEKKFTTTEFRPGNGLQLLFEHFDEGCKRYEMYKTK